MRDSISEFFGFIYENIFGFFSLDYFLIFTYLLNEWGYIQLGFVFLFIPLLVMIVFYYFYNNPYAVIFQWVIFLFVSAGIVFGLSYGIAYNEILASSDPTLIAAINAPETGYRDYAEKLPLRYGMANGFLALITGFIWSLGLKQLSKVQMHLPF